MDNILNYLKHFWISLGSFPLIIQVAIFFIFFSCFTTIALMISVFMIRKAKERNQKIVNELRPRIFTFLRNILISQDQYSENEVNAIYVENFGTLNKKAYLSLIPTLEDVAQQEKKYIGSDNYNSIVKGLRIDTHLERRLDFSSTRSRLRAFQSLSRLELTVSDSKILPHTYAKNASLRKESRASYVGVSNNDPFKFFETESEMNNWDQISLMQQFQLHHKDNLPSFSKWIKYSNNPAQIKFFIRMVAHFNQTTAISTLVELLSNTDHSVRLEAILALGKMQADGIENKLTEMYFTQPLSCQDAIIECLSYLNTGKSLDFLKMAYDMAANSDSKRLIAEVIYLYGTEGKNLFEILCQNEQGFDLQILNHVQNPLIPSALKNYHKTQSLRKNEQIQEDIATEQVLISLELSFA